MWRDFAYIPTKPPPHMPLACKRTSKIPKPICVKFIKNAMKTSKSCEPQRGDHQHENELKGQQQTL